jgi:hypothetical protein
LALRPETPSRCDNPSHFALCFLSRKNLSGGGILAAEFFIAVTCNPKQIDGMLCHSRMI